jgi:hypothetical protein
MTAVGRAGNFEIEISVLCETPPVQPTAVIDRLYRLTPNPSLHPSALFSPPREPFPRSLAFHSVHAKTQLLQQRIHRRRAIALKDDFVPVE